jgi:hypothetical protein
VNSQKAKAEFLALTKKAYFGAVWGNKISGKH